MNSTYPTYQEVMKDEDRERASNLSAGAVVNFFMVAAVCWAIYEFAVAFNPNVF